MDVKIDTDGIDNKINSEYIKPGIIRAKENEEVPAHIEYDKAELSSKALDLKDMQMKTMSFPDVRAEKVEQIKMLLESGTYNISPGDIAERLIEEAMALNY